jgi:hypothetical protein
MIWISYQHKKSIKINKLNMKLSIWFLDLIFNFLIIKVQPNNQLINIKK